MTRRLARHALAPLLFAALGAVGCSHTVKVRVVDNAAADVSVDGHAVGAAPVDYEEDLGVLSSEVRVKARLHDGRVLESQLVRSEVSPIGIAAGTGLGAIGCVGFVIAGGVAGALTGGACAAVSCLACPAFLAGPLAGAYLWASSPDELTLRTAAPPSTRPESTLTRPPPPMMEPPPLLEPAPTSGPTPLPQRF